MNRFKYQPRSGEEVQKAAPDGTRILLYSNLCRLNAAQLLNALGRNNIILYQDPTNMSSGHWVSLSFHPEIKEAYFFSSYGGKPDEEKNRWLSYQMLRNSGQERNVINDLLKLLFLNGWKIYYNDHRYQQEGDHSATCGIWSSAFLQSGINPDIFAKKHKSVDYYYQRYF